MCRYDEVADLLGDVPPKPVWTRGCDSGHARDAISRQVDPRADPITLFPHHTVAWQPTSTKAIWVRTPHSVLGVEDQAPDNSRTGTH